MKKTYILIVAILAIFAIQSNILRVVNVANIKGRPTVLVTSDCQYNIRVQHTQQIGSTLNVVLVADRIKDRVCEGEKNSSVVVSKKQYKTICINGKCWKVK